MISDNLSQDNLAMRVERERVAHDEHDVMAMHNELKSRFPHVDAYSTRIELVDCFNSYMDNLHGKVILDYGCGRGDMSLRYLRAGAVKVCAIDISSVYIADAERRMHEAGFSAERYSARVMDAHHMDFPDNSFDIVAGWSILHHLQPEVAMAEIHRVLKPGGRVLLWEPLADNPLLRIFRWLTPKARTADEAPFTGVQIKHLEQAKQWRSELGWCGLLGAPVGMVTSLLMKKRPKNFLLSSAVAMERWTHKKRILLNWNQHVLFNMVKLG
jgi:ubiquinone/menaquinone biosynthesis C-methylase UbiE